MQFSWWKTTHDIWIRADNRNYHWNKLEHIHLEGMAIDVIQCHNPHVYIPDFCLRWCYYRIYCYINIYNMDWILDKLNCRHCIQCHLSNILIIFSLQPHHRFLCWHSNRQWCKCVCSRVLVVRLLLDIRWRHNWRH